MSAAAIGMALGASSATAAGVGATVIGSALSGAASAWSARSERKAEEKARIAEEERREARYDGLGQASRYWENGQGQENATSPAQRVAAAPGLGKRPDQVGSRYAISPNSQLPQPKKPRWKFDPEKGVEKTY